MAFHLAPRRASRAGDVDCINARLRQSDRVWLADSKADLFGDHRDTQRSAESLDPFQQPAELHVARRLQRLLERIQMNDQRIRAQHVDETSCVIDGQASVQLHGAEIGEQRDVRGQVTNVERR